MNKCIWVGIWWPFSHYLQQILTLSINKNTKYIPSQHSLSMMIQVHFGVRMSNKLTDLGE